MSLFQELQALPWDRQECPGCRDTGKVRSEISIHPEEWEHTCDRCDIRWHSDEPIDEGE
jgi:hypothetical protein